MSVADAYVDLHVNGDNLDGEIRTSVRRAARSGDREADAGGQRLGSRMAAGFLKKWKSVVPNIKANFQKSFQGIFKGLNLKGLMLPAIGALIPFITSSLSALTGAATAFIGSMASATPAVFALSGLVGGLATAGIVAKIAFGGLGDAIKGTEGALEKLAPSAQALVGTLKGLGPAWSNMKKNIQGRTFEGIGPVVEKLSNAYLPVLQKRFGQTAGILNQFFKRTGGFLSSEKYVKNFSTALKGNNKIFETLGKAAVPIIRGITNAYIAILPFAQRVAESLLRGARSFSKWGVEGRKSGAIAGLMERAFTATKALWKIISNLGSTLRNVFGAATPAGDGLLQTLGDLTERLKNFTELASTKSSIAKWAEDGIAATGNLFSFLGRIGSALGPIFNPNLVNSYISVFEKMSPVIGSVVNTISSALTPILKGLGDAFSENGPKFKALFDAIAPLLKGVGSVVGELIKQVVGTLGTVAAVLTPIIRIISNFVGPLLTKFAPIIATIIFAFTNWTSVIFKMIPVIGRFLVPLAKLAQWIWGKLGPAIGFLGKIFGKTFKAMFAVGGFVLKALGMVVKTHFTIIRVIITGIMKGVLATVKFVWRGIMVAVRFAVTVIGTVVRTYFNIVRTVVTGVFRGILAVTRFVWNTMRAVIGGVVRGVVAVVKGSWNAVRNVTVGAWNGLRNITTNLWNRMSDAFRNGVSKVIGFIKGLPGKVLSLAGAFAASGRDLGGKIISGLMDGLRATGGFVSDLIGSIKGAINSALSLPFTIKGPGPLPDFTIPAFARGTIAAPGGVARVGERGPENVILPRGSKVETANRTRAGDRNSARATAQRKIILRIGSRDFEAYVEDLADDRIDAADSLAFQGA